MVKKQTARPIRQSPPPKLRLWKKFENAEDAAEVRQYLSQIEASSSADLKAEIPNIQIAGTKKLTVEGKEVIICLIPQKAFVSVRRVHQRLISELEKKANRYFIMICQRPILPGRKHISDLKKQPLNQRLSHVHNCYMEDICGPTEVVGKRVRFREGGKRILKIHVDAKDKTKIEDKLTTFNAVHRFLLERDAIYKFPDQ